MKLVWHIVRKDLWHVRLHLLLLALSGVVVCALALQVVPPEEGRQNWDSPALYLCLYLALWISVIPAMLQTDAPTGTTEFWMTRPISAGTLFAAKLIEGFLALAWVLGGYAVFLFTQGFRSVEVASVVGGMIPGFAEFGVFALLIASLTRGIGRFWFVFLAVGLGGMIALIAWGRASIGTTVDTSVELTPTREELWLLLTSVGALLLVGFQYRHRKATQGWISAGAVVVAVTLLAVSWRWSIERRFLGHSPHASWPVQISTGLSLDDDTAEPFPRLLLYVRPPAGTVARIGAINGNTTWSDGRSLEAEGNFTSTYVGRIAAVESALDSGYTVSEGGRTEEGPIEVAVVPSGEFSEAGNLRPTRFDGELDGTQLRYSLVGNVALAEGAALRWDGSKLVVLQTPLHDRAHRLAVRFQARENSVFPGKELSRPLLVLINRARKEARILPSKGSSESEPQGLPGLDLLAIAWNFSTKNPDQTGNVSVDDAWLANAEIVVFAEHFEANVSQSFATVVNEEGGRAAWSITTPALRTLNKFRWRSFILDDTKVEVTGPSP